MGQMDRALSIQFEPTLSFNNVSIPDEVSFIIANSLTESRVKSVIDNII